MRIHLALQEGQENKGHKGATSESRWSLISSSKKFYNGLRYVPLTLPQKTAVLTN